MDHSFWNWNRLKNPKLLKLKYRRGDQIIQLFCRIGSPQEIRSSSLICRNFKILEWSSWIMQNTLQSNEWQEFWSLNVLKLKYRRSDEIIQPFCRIRPPFNKEGRPSLIHWNFKSLWKLHLNHAELIEI